MRYYSLLFVLASILFFIFFFRVTNSYHMPPMYNYDSDFGRDLLMIQNITQGKLTLVGPQFSFAGLRLGPYHFYLFAPFLKIGAGDHRFVIYTNAFFFLIGLILVFIYLSKRTNYSIAFLSTVWLATTPYFILSARSPGNAFSYLIFLLIYLFYLFQINNLSIKKSLFLGFAAGVIINYHPMSLLSVVLPFLYIIYLNKNKLRQKLLNLGGFIISLSISFLPVLIFDIKHGFVITKSIFSEKALEFGGWAPHYSFPFFILFQAIFVFVIAKFRYAGLILLLVITINLFYFPINLYKPSRSLYKIENSFDKAINQMNLPKTDLNVILINETYLSAVGYEYRFLLTKKGFKIDNEYSYNNSQYLLVISEKGKDALKDFKSWELNQFGNKKLIAKYQKDDLFLYLFKKL